MCKCTCKPAKRAPQTIDVVRPLAQLKAGDLISAGANLAFVCWVEISEASEESGPENRTIAYRDVNGGDYHERTARDSYTVWLEHPAIGAHRTLEAECLAWGE